jgi:hypothetical protein
VAGLVVVWLVAFAVALRWWTPHPNRLPWLAAGLAAVWFVTVAGGAALVDWGSG